MRSSRRAIIHSMTLAALLVVTGCAATAPERPVQLERFRATALQGEPRLAVMIARNDDCTFQPATETQSCIAQDVTPEQSEWFVRCLAGGFSDSSYHPDIRSLDADVALRAALAQLPMEMLLTGEVAGGLADSGILARLKQENVSHVVVFAFKLTRNYRKENRSEVADTGGNGAIGLGGSSVRYFRVDFSGSVIDVPAAALAGRLTTYAEGGSGVGGGLIMALPIPIPIPIIFPVFDNMDAKGDSCEVLGNSIARFLYSKARPEHDAEPQ